jgi:hypothetical protein
MFMTAVSFFGTLISQINEIIKVQADKTKDLDNILEAYFSVHPGWVVPQYLYHHNN